MLLRVSCLLRSNHQATAKISGYNQRYRENRTKNTRPSGSWRVSNSYAAWCVISDRSPDLMMIWSNPAFQLGLPPSRACDHRFPVGAHPTSSPGLFPKKMGGGGTLETSFMPMQMDTNIHGGRRNQTGETSVSNFATKAWIHFSRTKKH